MPIHRPIMRLSVVVALGTAVSGAQSVEPTRWSIGAMAQLGGPAETFLNASSNYVGLDGSVRLFSKSRWALRADGSYLKRVPPHGNEGCVIPAIFPPNYACDTRRLGSIGTLAATALYGALSTDGHRPIYALISVGATATRWGGGYFVPAGSSPTPTEFGAGAGPSTAIVQLGVGGEHRAWGGRNRVELRVQRYSSAAERNKTALVLSLGRAW